MAKHEFGIMPTPPKAGERYDDYEPVKYDCISVDDECIEAILPELLDVEMYRHTIDCPGSGLAYCGVTLISPDSIDAILNIIVGNSDFLQLSELFVRAKAENRFVIHYGL